MHQELLNRSQRRDALSILSERGSSLSCIRSDSILLWSLRLGTRPCARTAILLGSTRKITPLTKACNLHCQHPVLRAGARAFVSLLPRSHCNQALTPAIDPNTNSKSPDCSSKKLQSRQPLATLPLSPKTWQPTVAKPAQRQESE